MVSGAVPLDVYDLRLLGLLQEDATLSIAEMAERIALSSNACWKRVKRLEAEGYVRKRVALLDADKLGAGVTVFVSVRAAEHSEQWLADFASAVRRLPEVVEFYRMSGDTDYLLKIQIADIELASSWCTALATREELRRITPLEFAGQCNLDFCWT